MGQSGAPCFDYPTGLTVSTTVSWTTPQRVHGTIRVQNGGILIIRGTTVEFDDTENMPDAIPLTANDPSRIVVEPGGLLRVINSTLKPLAPRTGCPTAAMWDGIVLLGDPQDAQGVQGDSVVDLNQGKAYLTGSTLEQARIGLLMGTPAYTSNELTVSAVTTNGGGWARVYTTTFLNCHTGAYLTTYRPLQDNRTLFGTCIFRADAPLASAGYVTAGVAPGTQYGVRAFDVGRVKFVSCTFELLDETAAFGNVALPYQLRGRGLASTNATFIVTNSTFRNLYRGVWVTNDKLAYPIFLADNTFNGNIEGATLSGVLAPIVRNNTFQVGRGSFQFPFGLALYGSPSGQVYDNDFLSTPASPGPGCANNVCPYARGLNVTQLDGPAPSNPIANEIYRNSFSYLSTGIYVQRGASNTLLRCNSFRGSSRTVGATIARSDIEVYIGNLTTMDQRDMLRNRDITGGMVTGHGRCNVDQSQAANNFFSYTGGSARSILVMHTPNLPTLIYNYTPSSANTAPQTVTAPNVNGISGVAPISCTGSSPFEYVDACPAVSVDPTRSPEELRAALDTLTNSTEYSLTLNELLRYYLHDTTGLARLDSAIAVLATYGSTAYTDVDAGLRQLAGYPPGEGWRVTTATGTAQRPGAGLNTLYDDVQALLAPYADDRAALATAVRTDEALQTALRTLAHDTTTWGYVSAQAVLSQYLDEPVTPWYESATVTLLRPTAPLGTAEAAATRLKVATLYPNPATDAVTVQYALPANAPSSGAELVLTDALGKECARLALRGTSGETTLSLAHLPAGYYAYRVLLNGTPVQRATFVKLP